MGGLQTVPAGSDWSGEDRPANSVRVGDSAKWRCRGRNAVEKARERREEMR